MFGPLRSKQLNLLGWKAQISFWTNLIKSWCIREKKCSFNQNDLELAFQKDGRTPQCLKDIIEEGKKHRVFLECNRYSAWLQSQESWSSWIRSTPWLAAWALQDKLFPRDSELIVPCLVEEMAYKTLLQIRKTKPLLSAEDHIFVSKEALDQIDSYQKQILEFLKCKRLIDTGSVDNVEVVKVSLNKDTEVELEDGDLVLLKIIHSLKSLDADIEKQQNSIKVVDYQVRQLLKSNSKSFAMNILRKRKMLENKMKKTFDQKNNLVALLDELMNVKSNKKVIESYKSGLGELRSKMRELNSENVEEILSDIREVLEENNDISEAISNDVLGDVVDVEEFEKEFKDLDNDENDIDPFRSRISSNVEENLVNALEKLELENLEPEIGVTKTKTKKLKEKQKDNI